MMIMVALDFVIVLGHLTQCFYVLDDTVYFQYSMLISRFIVG